MTDEEWTATVVALFEAPLRAAGVGEPNATEGARYVMWHSDGWGDTPRPCPDSVVWQPKADDPRSASLSRGCYDVTVREDPVWGEDVILCVHTEGGSLLEVAPPTDVAGLRATLEPVAARIADTITDDFARFESDNAGYLPGTEPGAQGSRLAKAATRVRFLAGS